MEIHEDFDIMSFLDFLHKLLDKVYLREKIFIFCFKLSIEIFTGSSCSGVPQNNSVRVDHWYNDCHYSLLTLSYFFLKYEASWLKHKYFMNPDSTIDPLDSPGCNLPMINTTLFSIFSSKVPTFMMGISTPVNDLPIYPVEALFPNSFIYLSNWV